MNIAALNSLKTAQFKPVQTQNIRQKPSFGLANMPTNEQYNDLRVFYHHIYEYKKGLRSLVLTTEKADNRAVIESKLKREKISYKIKEVNKKNINVFFGNKDCIRIVSTFDKPLNELTPEQDFMLGIMLGYDKILQCKRYFVMRDKYFKNMKTDS